MKKIYVLLLVSATLLSFGKAQSSTDNLLFKKGDKLLGGSFNVFNNSSSSNSSVTSFSIIPSFGFFTKPNRLTGFSIGFSSNNPSYKQRSFGASVYKQYWSPLGHNFYFIMQGQIGAGYGYIKSIAINFNPYGEQVNKNYTIYGSASPGFAFRINRRLLVNTFLTNMLYVSYDHTKTTESYSNNTSYKSHQNLFGLSTSFSQFNISSFQFGFNYIL